jgi:predicted PurR-regulated permease PerM
MYRVIKGYVNGQVLLALIASLLIAPMLFILHIGYPIALVFVIFICGLIPMVGHTIGAIIVTLVALFHSPISAVIILAYYILYQQIENYAVQPRVQASSTQMSPLIVFSSVLLGVSFGGLLGGLVAIPIAGCIRIVLLDYLRSRKVIGPAETELTAETK